MLLLNSFFLFLALIVQSTKSLSQSMAIGPEKLLEIVQFEIGEGKDAARSRRHSAWNAYQAIQRPFKIKEREYISFIYKFCYC